MEFKQLQSFVTVVKYMSFTRAAEKLYLSQPTISAHIHALETELGTVLLSRTTKSLALTPQGQQLYEDASNLLTLRDRMVRNCAEDAVQQIYLGASTIPSAYVLPEVIAAYRCMHPEISFTIRQGDSREIISDLVDGIYDIGLVGMACEQPGIHCEPLCSDRMVLITPAGLTGSAVKSEHENCLTEILSGPFILREEGSGSGKSLTKLLHERGMAESDLQVAARSDDTTAICRMVAAGVGSACVSARAAELFALSGMVQVYELPEMDAVRKLYLLTRENALPQAHIVEFVEFLRDVETVEDQKMVPARLTMRTK